MLAFGVDVTGGRRFGFPRFGLGLIRRVYDGVIGVGVIGSDMAFRRDVSAEA